MTTADSDVPLQSSTPRGGESDAELAIRFEREALPLLDALYRGALALTRDRLEAQDRLQETMMDAYKDFDSLPENTNLRTSLYRALTNACITSCGTRHRQLAEGPADTAADRQRQAKALRTMPGLSAAEAEALEAMPKPAPHHRCGEIDTCAGQLDWFDREIVCYVLLWAPYGEVWDEDVYPTFGLTVEQLVDRFHRIIDTSMPRLGRLSKLDRELLDKARQLPRIFSQKR